MERKMSMNLGTLKRNQTVRIPLTLEVAPTGTPQIAIYKNATEILAATNMTQGASTLDWYYDYAVANNATTGAYQVKFSAVIGGVTHYDYDVYDVKVYDSDDIKIDTETIIANLGVSSGARAIVFNVTDGVDPIIDVKLSVHNSNNDDSPQFGILTTDALGDTGTINLDDGTYKVRVSKAGAIVSEVKTATVTQSETIDFEVTAITITPPVDPDLCRLYIYPITLDNQDVTDITIKISSKDALTKINGEFIKNTSAEFTYDNSTTPDNYYFDALQGATVIINCDMLGIIDKEITVPDTETADLDDLIS